MTLKTTAAVLAALTFLATPITAQTQNTTTQTTPTIAAVDLAALQASCVSRTNNCSDATFAALNAFLLQKPTPAQINAQIGLIAAMLITIYNANPARMNRIRGGIVMMIFFSSDVNQKRVLDEINLLMANQLPVTLNANASALSPS